MQQVRMRNEYKKFSVFKNSTPFSLCITKTDKTLINNAKDLAITMSTYKLL